MAAARACCEIELMGEDGHHDTAGITGTAMRVVNAIPAVCGAPPGVVSIVDPIWGPDLELHPLAWLVVGRTCGHRTW